MNDKLLQPAFSLGSLSSYIQWVNKIPLLTAEEEYSYATQLGEENNLEAAQKLILAHLRFVVRVARGYSGYGLPQADLIQEGNIGLMKAVKRFNPRLGVRLVSFAVHWIRAEIHEFVIKNWRIVKVATTKAQRKLFFNLRKASKKLGWFSNDEAEAVAEELNVTVTDVRDMELRLSAYDESFEVTPNEDSAVYKPIHYLEDNRYNPSDVVERCDKNSVEEQRLYQALMTLDKRSQDILRSRWLSEEKLTLETLAEKYSVSLERIRQIEKNAIQKLHTWLAA